MVRLQSKSILIPWKFFTEIRKNAQASHQLDLRVMFGVLSTDSQSPILDVHFFNAGLHITLQLTSAPDPTCSADGCVLRSSAMTYVEDGRKGSGRTAR